ncbi:hypothetical protein HOF56_03200 [Candidatus Peribacteria bacterium]|jgi:hypothetical protein|nr:hypothetical protein [Candidatus Peribacteria bacterium]MBT4021162.1 hypothetical protein [Candidatus Peribacteria bacterium]MBT4240938.1 hypothetical protein [Candidatus Peribacteria bacterium]MBT4474581.1 hypothetical protein [Candidatus Peribacteria bacterium]
MSETGFGPESWSSEERRDSFEPLISGKSRSKFFPVSRQPAPGSTVPSFFDECTALNEKDWPKEDNESEPR